MKKEKLQKKLTIRKPVTKKVATKADTSKDVAKKQLEEKKAELLKRIEELESKFGTKVGEFLRNLLAEQGEDKAYEYSFLKETDASKKKKRTFTIEWGEDENKTKMTLTGTARLKTVIKNIGHGVGKVIKIISEETGKDAKEIITETVSAIVDGAL